MHTKYWCRFMRLVNILIVIGLNACVINNLNLFNSLLFVNCTTNTSIGKYFFSYLMYYSYKNNPWTTL